MHCVLLHQLVSECILSFTEYLCIFYKAVHCSLISIVINCLLFHVVIHYTYQYSLQTHALSFGLVFICFEIHSSFFFLWKNVEISFIKKGDTNVPVSIQTHQSHSIQKKIVDQIDRKLILSRSHVKKFKYKNKAIMVYGRAYHAFIVGTCIFVLTQSHGIF
jgi:hypothetical protein